MALCRDILRKLKLFGNIGEVVTPSVDLGVEKYRVQCLVFAHLFWMACSAVSLLVPTVSAVVGLTCTAFAFGTDNWYEVRMNPDGDERLANLLEFESDPRYYSRDEGIFRICFLDKTPKGGKNVKYLNTF